MEGSTNKNGIDIQTDLVGYLSRTLTRLSFGSLTTLSAILIELFGVGGWAWTTLKYAPQLKSVNTALRAATQTRLPGFEMIPNRLAINETAWDVIYDDIDTQDNSVTLTASIDFNQMGSRVSGTGRDASREWLLEGATVDRRLIYIYVDEASLRESFGAVLLELNAAGDTLSGQWLGWSPESQRPAPRRIVLAKR